MKIFVKAKPGSKENKVLAPEKKLWSEIANTKEYYTVYVKDRPVRGKANFAIERQLAEYFKVSMSRVKLISGNTSKTKVFEIIGL